MITKEQLKKEVDKLPENMLEEVYTLLKEVLDQNQESEGPTKEKIGWSKWNSNLEKFTPDFMESREQYTSQIRESCD
ncbi:MAG TPA: hypothetical protein PLJ60_04565 [Chryseolinea sp.]|nr:hypothetical protein [Chryseolinea sp.]HPH46789.1 hypothetical protein [Chryseolinea sp.]HPM29589.1 hypothetical protein [Chryseolinea sp.]